MRTELTLQGFAWVRDAGVIAAAAADSTLRPIRDVLGTASEYARLAGSGELRAIAAEALQRHAWPVRANLFVKSSGANWAVPWHQDLVVCVRERHEHPDFHGWSSKRGLAHAIAPESILRSMVALRVHLDPCGDDAGPLEVIPGSHRAVHDRTSRRRLMRESASQLLPALRGDVLVMSPLLLHRSRCIRSAHPRRILHVEFSSVELPAPLAWRHGDRMS